jgi:Fur family peroxide stress response transcriptional regulator
MGLSDNTEKTIARAFREHRYRATPQRIAVSKYALTDTQHSAKRIYYEVAKTYPTISLATVYTTLKILKDIGLIRELNLADDQTRFDPNTLPHVHLICLRCGSITDWTEPMLEELINKISSDTGFTVKESSMNISGFCKDCQKED